jgi:hypothetical protein
VLSLGMKMMKCSGYNYGTMMMMMMMVMMNEKGERDG